MRGSAINAADQIVNEIGYAFASQLDFEGISGDGTSGSPDFGILGAIEGMSDFSEIAGPANWDADDAAACATYRGKFAAMIGRLPDRFHGTGNTPGSTGGTTSEAVWVCSRAFWSTVMEPCMLDLGGNTKFDAASRTPFGYGGYRVFFTEKMPTAYATTETPLLLGNFYDAMLLGQREDVGIAISEHDRFSFDQLSIRGRTSYDLQYHEKGDATTAGAIIGLKSA